MLHLKNIKRSHNCISANYQPEDSNELGHIRISLIDGEVLESTPTTLDEPLNVYMSHAIMALVKCKDMVELPTERTIMWY